MARKAATGRRLLFCSSVSPRATSAGELLVYRHLLALRGWEVMDVVVQDKPPSIDLQHDLQVLLPLPPRWLQRFRRGLLFGFADSLAANWLVKRFSIEADQFRPDAVLSVMLPDMFLSAAALFARRRNLPLVLLCHDDYSDYVPQTGRDLLARVYRESTVRLCVSSAMEEEFFVRYGVHGELLYPIPQGRAVVPKDTEDGDPLVVGFAGSIGLGYVGAILNLADALAEDGGRMVIASPTPRDSLSAIFSHPVVSDLGALPPAEVRTRLLGAGVNVLAVVQSFAAEDERAFRFNFPSKLTEYATYGLPVLVVAPEASSAAVWSRKTPGAALLVGDGCKNELRLAVRRLNTATERRLLANGFYSAASSFDPALLQRKFEDALIRASAAIAAD